MFNFGVFKGFFGSVLGIFGAEGFVQFGDFSEDFFGAILRRLGRFFGPILRRLGGFFGPVLAIILPDFWVEVTKASSRWDSGGFGVLGGPRERLPEHPRSRWAPPRLSAPLRADSRAQSGFESALGSAGAGGGAGGTKGGRGEPRDSRKQRNFWKSAQR